MIARALVTPRWRLSAATPRSRCRTKMSQGRNGRAAGQQMPRRYRRQARALAAARRLGNKYFRSPRSSADLELFITSRAPQVGIESTSPPTKAVALPTQPQIPLELVEQRLRIRAHFEVSKTWDLHIYAHPYRLGWMHGRASHARVALKGGARIQAHQNIAKRLWPVS
jgi:hypothetical protein